MYSRSLLRVEVLVAAELDGGVGRLDGEGARGKDILAKKPKGGRETLDRLLLVNSASLDDDSPGRQGGTAGSTSG